MTARTLYRAQLSTLIAIFCLLTACGSETDADRANKGNLSDNQKLVENPEEAFFENDIGRTPIRLRLERDPQGQTLYAMFRLPKVGQAAETEVIGKIKLCTIGSDQELQVVIALLQRGTIGATVLRDAALSYVVTFSIPANLDLSKKTSPEKDQLLANALLISWPALNDLRTCRYNLESPRLSSGNRAGSRASKAKGGASKKDNSKSDWFGTQN